MAKNPEMIRQAQEGDPTAFAGLVETYRKRVYGTVYRLVGKSDEVEDVGQDVFLRLHTSLHQLRTVDVFDTWLYRLTVNTVYDHLRRRRRGMDVPMADLSDEQILSADASESTKRHSVEKRKADAREKLAVILRHISDDDRQLLTRKEIQGLTLKELRTIYDANEGALKVRLFRARKRALEAHERLAAQGVM